MCINREAQQQQLASQASPEHAPKGKEQQPVEGRKPEKSVAAAVAIEKESEPETEEQEQE